MSAAAKAPAAKKTLPKAVDSTVEQLYASDPTGAKARLDDVVAFTTRPATDHCKKLGFTDVVGGAFIKNWERDGRFHPLAAQTYAKGIQGMRPAPLLLYKPSAGEAASVVLVTRSSRDADRSTLYKTASRAVSNVLASSVSVARTKTACSFHPWFVSMVHSLALRESIDLEAPVSIAELRAAVPTANFYVLCVPPPKSTTETLLHKLPSDAAKSDELSAEAAAKHKAEWVETARPELGSEIMKKLVRSLDAFAYVPMPAPAPAPSSDEIESDEEEPASAPAPAAAKKKKRKSTFVLDSESGEEDEEEDDEEDESENLDDADDEDELDEDDEDGEGEDGEDGEDDEGEDEKNGEEEEDSEEDEDSDSVSVSEEDSSGAPPAKKRKVIDSCSDADNSDTDMSSCAAAPAAAATSDSESISAPAERQLADKGKPARRRGDTRQPARDMRKLITQQALVVINNLRNSAIPVGMLESVHAACDEAESQYNSYAQESFTTVQSYRLHQSMIKLAALQTSVSAASLDKSHLDANVAASNNLTVATIRALAGAQARMGQLRNSLQTALESSDAMLGGMQAAEEEIKRICER